MRPSRSIAAVALVLVLVLVALWFGIRLGLDASAEPDRSSPGATARTAPEAVDTSVPGTIDDEAPSSRTAVGTNAPGTALDGRSLALRLLDEAGRPIADAACRVVVWVEAEGRVVRREDLTLRTNGAARLVVPVRLHWDPSVRRFVRLAVADPRDRSASSESFELSGALEDGITEIGDFRFGDPRISCTGRVFGSDGEPWQGAYVIGWLQEPCSEPWQQSGTGASGAYKIGGLSFEPLLREPRRMLLRARAHRHAWSDPVELVLENTGGEPAVLDFHLEGGGAILGHVDVAPTANEFPPTLAAYRTDFELLGYESFAASSFEIAEVETELEPPPFRFNRLTRGTYRVEVRTSVGEVLASVAGLVVHEGEVTTDPRLEPLQVEAIPSAELRFVDERGRELSVVEVTRRVVDASGAPRWHAFGTMGSMIRLRAATEDPPVFVRAEGKVPQRVDVEPGAHDVRLEAARRVTWQFSRAANAGEHERRVRLVATTTPVAGLDWPLSYELELPFVGLAGSDATERESPEKLRPFEARLPSFADPDWFAPGEYELAWVADGDEGEQWRWVDLDRARITIERGEGTQRVEISPPDDLLERLDGGERSVPTAPIDPWRPAQSSAPRPARPGRR